MGALVRAWKQGKSSGDEEGGLESVAIGGMLVKRTALGACAGCGAGVEGV